MPNVRRSMMAAAGSGASGPDAVNFNGSTWLSRGADMTGLSSSDYWTFSFWYKFDSTTDSKVYENRSETVKFANTYLWQIEADDTINDGYEGLDTDLTKWHHTCGMVNSASAENTNYYRDDALISPLYQLGTRDGTNISVSSIDHFFFTQGGPSRGAYFQGSIYEFWMDWGQNIDLTNTTTRRKFINADLTPVDLGSDGATPTGTAPTVYFTGGPSDFATNLGTGGAFSVGAGSLVAAVGPTVANQS